MNTTDFNLLASAAQRQVDIEYEANQAKLSKEKVEVLLNSGGASLFELKEALQHLVIARKGEQYLVRNLYREFLPHFEALKYPRDKLNSLIQKMVSQVAHPNRASRKARNVGDFDSDGEDFVEVVKKDKSNPKAGKASPSDSSWRAPEVDYASSVADLISHGNAAVAREMNYQYAKFPRELEDLNRLMRASGRQFSHASTEFPPEGSTSLQRKIYRRIVGAVPIQGRISMVDGDDVLTGKAFAGRIAVHSCLLFVEVIVRVLGIELPVKILNDTCGGLPFLVVGTTGADVFIVDPAEKVRKFDDRVSGRVLNLVSASAVYANVEEGKKVFATLFKTRANRWRQIMATAMTISDERAKSYVPVKSFGGRITSMARKMDEYYDEFCNSSNYNLMIRLPIHIVGKSEYPSALWSLAEKSWEPERRAGTLPTLFEFPWGDNDLDLAVSLLAKIPGGHPFVCLAEDVSTKQHEVRAGHVPIGLVEPAVWFRLIPKGFLNMPFGVFHVACLNGYQILKTHLGSYRLLGSDHYPDYKVAVGEVLARYEATYPNLSRALKEWKDSRPQPGTPVRGTQVAVLCDASSDGSSSDVSISASELEVVMVVEGTKTRTVLRGPTAPTVSVAKPAQAGPSQGVKPEVQPAKPKADKAKEKSKADAAKPKEKPEKADPKVTQKGPVGKGESAAESKPAVTKAKNEKVSKPVQASPAPKETVTSNKAKDKTDAAGVGKVDDPPGTEQGKVSKPSKEPTPPGPKDDPPSNDDWEKIRAVVLAMHLKTVQCQIGVPREIKGTYSYNPVTPENMAYSVHEGFWYPAPDYWRRVGRPCTFTVEYTRVKGKSEVKHEVVYYYMLHKKSVIWSTQKDLPEYEGVWGYIPWERYQATSGGFHYQGDNATFNEGRRLDYRQMMAALGRAERMMEKQIPSVMQGIRDEQIDALTKSLYADTLGENNVVPHYGPMVGEGNYVIKTGGQYFHVSPKFGWRPWQPINSALTSWFNFRENTVAQISIHYSSNLILVKGLNVVSPVQKPWYEFTVDGDKEICIPVSFVNEVQQVVKTNAPSQTTSSRILASLAALKLPSEFSGVVTERMLELMSDYVKKDTAQMSDQLNRINYHASLHSLAVQDTQSFAKWTYPHLRSNPLSISTVSVLIQIVLPWLLTSLMGWQGIGYGVSHHSFSKLITLSDYLHVLHDAGYWTILLMTTIMVWAAIGDWIAGSALIWTRLRRPDVVTEYTELVAWADNLCWQAGLLARLVWVPAVVWFLVVPWFKRTPAEAVEGERMAATLPSQRVQFSAWCVPNFKFSQNRIRKHSFIRIKNFTHLGDGIMDDFKWKMLAKARPITHPGPILHSMIEAFPNFVLAQTPWNTLVALRERALRFRLAPNWQAVEGFRWALFHFLPRLDVEKASSADIDEWLRNRQAKYKDKYARVLSRLATHGFQYSKQDFEVGVFVKEETLPKLSPRIICTMSDNFNAYFGPWCSKFEKRVSDAVKETGYAVFTGGLSPMEKGQWYYDNLYQGNYWVLDIDASKWDASVPDEFIDAYYDYLIRCGWEDAKFMSHRRDYVVKKRFANGATIKAHIAGRFITSGAPDTYIGNSVMNLALQMWLAFQLTNNSQQAKEFKYMICGDDAIVGIPKASFPNTTALKRKIMETLDLTGMEFELNIVDSKDTHLFRYCSGFFAPSENLEGGPSLIHVPEPVRFLGKSYSYRPEVMESISLDEHRRAVNLCGFHSYSRDPVWSTVFKKKYCYTDSEPITEAMRINFGSFKWRELVAASLESTANVNWSEEAKARSWEFWGTIYPGLNDSNLKEIEKFIFRDELGLTKPKAYGFYSLSEGMSAILTGGLYRVASFHECLRAKLIKSDLEGDPRASNPFAFVVILEEMDSAINRLRRSEMENEQFRMQGAGRLDENPPVTYDAVGRNGDTLLDRVIHHSLWNRGTKTWTQALRGGLLDSFYMREMWDNPELAARVQWWQGEEVEVPILK